MRTALFFWLFLIIWSFTSTHRLSAQAYQPLSVEASYARYPGKALNVFVMHLRVSIPKGAHIYAEGSKKGYPTTTQILLPPGFKWQEKLQTALGHKIWDGVVKKFVLVYEGLWEVQGRFVTPQNIDDYSLANLWQAHKPELFYQICDNQFCSLPIRQGFTPNLQSPLSKTFP